MQTFVVKLASGVAAMIATICLQIFSISSENVEESTATIAHSSAVGLRMTMTILPIIGLVIAFTVYSRRYKLTESRIQEISSELKARKG